MNKKASLLIIMMALLLFSYGAEAGRAPGFALKNSSGNMVFLSKQKGNILISFFASYCAPCKKEIPHVIELIRKYKDKKLTLILIATDANGEKESARDKAAAFLKDIGVAHDFLLDIYQVVIARYNEKKNVPALFLLNGRKEIVFKAIGAHHDTLVKLERAILRMK